MGFDNLAAICNKAVTSSAMLGVTVSYFYKSGAVDASLEGVWNNETDMLDPETGAAVTVQRPRFGVRVSTMQEPPQKGDRLERFEQTYIVTDIEPNGYGISELSLQRVTR